MNAESSSRSKILPKINDAYLRNARRSSGEGYGCSLAMIRATHPMLRTTSTRRKCRRRFMLMSSVDRFQWNGMSAGGSPQSCSLVDILKYQLLDFFWNKKNMNSFISCAVIPSWIPTISRYSRSYPYTLSSSKQDWEFGSTGLVLWAHWECPTSMHVRHNFLFMCTFFEISQQVHAQVNSSHPSIILSIMHPFICQWSGDADGRVPVIGSRYCVEALKLRMKTQWQPWYLDKQVGLN